MNKDRKDRTIQLEEFREDGEREFWEGRRVTISPNVSRLEIPSERGRMTFYSTGRFAEPDIEIWSLREVK